MLIGNEMRWQKMPHEKQLGQSIHLGVSSEHWAVSLFLYRYSYVSALISHYSEQKWTEPKLKKTLNTLRDYVHVGPSWGYCGFFLKMPIFLLRSLWEFGPATSAMAARTSCSVLLLCEHNWKNFIRSSLGFVKSWDPMISCVYSRVNPAANISFSASG